MKYTTAFVAIALALVANATTASATALRTFVSPTGNDANPCNFSSPCRTLQAALLQTTAGGEIAILGTAGYNNGQTVNITQSVSIVNPGAFEAGIFVPAGGAGIEIDALPGDAVSLRGLTIIGGGAGNWGILFNTGKSLTVEDSVISDVKLEGIQFQPNASSYLYVSNTRLKNTAAAGIDIAPQIPGATATVQASLVRVEAVNNADGGVFVDGRSSGSATDINVTLADSVMAASSVQGIVSITSATGAPTLVMVRNTTVSHNHTGGYVSGGATLIFAHSTVSGNTTAFFKGSGSTLQSYLDNNVDGNNSLGIAPSALSYH